MPILKQIHDKSVSIPNETAQDRGLSLEALGALTRMCSYSDNFKFKVEWLQIAWNCGRGTVRRILRELREKGYLMTPPAKTKNGHFSGQEWFLSTRPVFNGTTENRSSRQTVPPSNGTPVFQECIKKREIVDLKGLNDLEEDLKDTHTHVLDAPAPAQEPGNGENGVCVDSKISKPKNADGHLSVYPIEVCERYAAFCQKRDGVIKSVEAVGQKIYLNGLSDAKIAAFLAAEIPIDADTKKAREELKANCPRCFGGGQEYRFGDDGKPLGIKGKCRHQPLVPGEPLYRKKAREDLDDAAAA